jgi:CRP/FNR family transcriptional regulator, anaerobic regulatory protein
MSWFAVDTQERNIKAGLVRPCNACAVREFSVCAPLDAPEQARVTQIMTQIEVEDGATIFDEAEPADHVFNITTGAVKVYKLLADGRRAITGFLFPGDFLGLTHHDSYAFTAEALSSTRLCRFPREKLERLLEDMPVLERRLLGLASHELAAAQDQMLLLGRKTAKERLASFLMLLSNAARRHGRPGDPVDLVMGRGDIADYLGLTIETVSRTFTQLKREGAIQLLDGNRVRLADKGALQDLAGFT